MAEDLKALARAIIMGADGEDSQVRERLAQSYSGIERAKLVSTLKEPKTLPSAFSSLDTLLRSPPIKLAVAGHDSGTVRSGSGSVR